MIWTVCQDLLFHLQVGSQEPAQSWLQDRQLDRRTYACQDTMTSLRLQKSWIRRDFSDALANSFHITNVRFYVFKMSAEIQKSCFPLKFRSQAVVSAYSKSCAVADCRLLVLIHGRQLRKAPVGKFKCAMLQIYVYRYIHICTHIFHVE